MCVSACLTIFRVTSVPATATSSSLIHREVILARTHTHTHTVTLPWNQGNFSEWHLSFVTSFSHSVLFFGLSLLLCFAYVVPQWPFWDFRFERRQRGRRRRSPWRTPGQATPETFCAKSITPWEDDQGETQCSQCNSTHLISPVRSKLKTGPVFYCTKYLFHGC